MSFVNIKKLIVIGFLSIFLVCGEENTTEENIQFNFNKVDIKKLCPVPEPKIFSFKDRIFVAAGYDLATVSMVLTSKGKVIIDTGSSPQRAKIIKQEFDKISQLPTVAIIYTHRHIDHTGGASVWVENITQTQIWATDKLTEEFFKDYGVWLRLQRERARMQFGFDLPDAELPCFSIGGRLYAPEENGFIKPTHTFSGIITFSIGDLTFELVEAHGETKDQLFVWIPELEALFSGDNFYLAFPNLYTVRGASERPVEEWIRSIDEMRRRDPVFLVSGHTYPISGRENIRETLTNYRDAIAYIWQRMVKLANEGYYMDDIAYHIKLPEHLQKDYLKETYGKVEWSLKGFYSWKIGWFDGVVEKLYSLPTTLTALKEVEALGGSGRVIELAKNAISQGELKIALFWLAKLKNAGMLEGEAKNLYIKVIEALAYSEENFIARSYLLEEKLKIEGKTQEVPTPKISESFVEDIPIETLFEAMQFRLKDNVGNTKLMVKFIFNDIQKTFTVTIRYGVVEVVQGEPLPGEGTPDIILEIPSTTYKKLALGFVRAGDVLSEIKITGNIQKLFDFMRMFDTNL